MANELLRLQNLSAGYGKLTILHGISLSVQVGQFVAILGPNGSGKSTLLKTIFGLTTVFDGSVQLDGNELIGIATERIGQLGIAYVPQRENVFPSLTVRENLLLSVRKLPRHAAEPRLQQATERFPILGKRQSQRAGQLSGGERQMLAIAIGWLAQPKIMLLDEPSAGLSPLFVTEVFRTLQTLTETGMTLVVVEQNARSILRWCSYAYVLREGQIAFQGSAAEILADEETVKGYLGVGERGRVGA